MNDKSKQAEQIVEAERPWARPALIAGASSLGLILVGQILQGSGGLADADTDSEMLVARSDLFGQLLLGAVLVGLGFLLFMVPLLFLNASAARRSPLVRPAFRPLLIIGPVLIAIAGVLSVIALDQVASDFIAGTPLTGDAAESRAEDLISDSTLGQVSQFAALAGSLALGAGVLYTALHAMRTGLLNRFWGTFGMAIGVIFGLSLLFGGIAFLGMLIWVVAVSIRISGVLPSGRPPAWDAGVAIPWPKPGEPSNVPDEEDALAAPEDFEGTATEIDEPEAIAEPARPARRDNKRKRKRKQRG